MPSGIIGNMKSYIIYTIQGSTQPLEDKWWPFSDWPYSSLEEAHKAIKNFVWSKDMYYRVLRHEMIVEAISIKEPVGKPRKIKPIKL